MLVLVTSRYLWLVYLLWGKSVAVVMGRRVVIVVPALVERVVSLAESKHIINFCFILSKKKNVMVIGLIIPKPRERILNLL